MTKQEIYNMLVRAKRPYDVFGDVQNVSGLKKEYTRLAKQIHPDTASSGKEKYICEQGFMVLGDLYDKGQQEISKGIYGITEPLDLYKTEDPLFEINAGGGKYRFYECICNGELSDIYRGLCGDSLVCVKIAVDQADNDLIKAEYDTLLQYSHLSMPVVRSFVKINGCSAIIMDNIEGEPLPDIMARHPRGIDPEHVMWIMERLFSVVGYLHSNFIVHGNIIPENIIINTATHNVVVTGFSFHIPNANQADSRYKVANEKFSPKGINQDTAVRPQSDIYSLGKLAVYMLGGKLYNNGMPMSVPADIRNFIRWMANEDPDVRPNDAWKLWDEWRKIRTRIYGNERFKEAVL